MKLAERLKTMRATKNWTQGELAEKLQVSRSTVSSWETGRSYPDLEMVMYISDQFDVSLDYLLREDEKMVKKLNFGAKQKKWLIGTIVVLVLLIGNIILSTMPVDLTSDNVNMNKVHVMRDASYDGGDANRDWNTTIDLTLRGNNPFFKPKSDDFLIWTKEEGYVITGSGTYSVFHLFDFEWTEAHQSFMIPGDVATEDIQLFVENEKKKPLEYTFSEINTH